MNFQQKITVCGFIHHKGKMLWLQRAATKKFLPNKWELIGGHVENWESLEGALIREIQEEIGVTVIVWDILHAFTYQKNETTQSVEVIYLCEILHPENITLHPEDHQCFKWITKEEVQNTYQDDDQEFPAILKGFEIINV